MKSADRPDMKAKSATAHTVESITDKDFNASTTTTPKKAKAARPTARTHIVQKGCKLNVTVAKIAGIYGELTTLLLSKHVHAIGVLLRVFLEMSLVDYLSNTPPLPPPFKNP